MKKLTEILNDLEQGRISVASAESRISLIMRSGKIDLLDRYTKFLQKDGYIDTDAAREESFAIDEFLKTEH